MILVRIALVALAALAASPASAEDRPPPMDTAGVDKSMFEGFYGPWIIRDADGSRACRVTLLEERGIGGRQIEVAPDCAAAFQVMDTIASWELLENWGIALIDVGRTTRFWFSEQEYGYSAEGAPDGIASIERAE